ncbi:MAG: DUF4280 domain-containing protein [Oscillospiraceae bacterium]|nr:DUF4280 domain-containing protein [Oscillospiraceae bacterium]
MANLVCGGAMLQCSFGQAPSMLMTLPQNKVMCSMPAANIMDNKPFVNILPFAMCTSMANPVVTAATAAAFGVLTPMPCVPVTPAPWTPGCPTVMIANQPALNDSSVLNCVWGGVIQIKQAGQAQVQTP